MRTEIKFFVKGAPRMNGNKSGEENVMGLHPSVKMSQVYADECMMDLADSPESKKYLGTRICYTIVNLFFVLQKKIQTIFSGWKVS
jgi:hypothetical protein